MRPPSPRWLRPSSDRPHQARSSRVARAATGGDAPTETQTTGCDIAGNGGGSRGTDWLLSPGLYPAGLTIDNQATAYLLPGIYWIGGGGLAVNGDASLISVDSQATATTMNSMPLNTRLLDSDGQLAERSGTPTAAES